MKTKDFTQEWFKNIESLIDFECKQFGDKDIFGYFRSCINELKRLQAREYDRKILLNALYSSCWDIKEKYDKPCLEKQCDGQIRVLCQACDARAKYLATVATSIVKNSRTI